MKKTLAICLIYITNSITAQLNFVPSGFNVPLNFMPVGMVTNASSEIYVSGAINSNGWIPKVYKSTDGSNWSAVAITGIGSSQIMYKALCYTGNKLFMSTQDMGLTATGIFSSTNGINWTSSNSGVPPNFTANGLAATSSSEIYAAGALFASGWTPKLYRSGDGGASWTAVAISGINASQIMFSALCYTGTKLLIATQDNSGTSTTIYSSADGLTWASSNTGVAANFIIQGFLAKSSSEIYAVGAHNNNPGWIPKIYKSTDGGATWALVSVVGPSPTQEMYNTVGTIGNKIILGTQNVSANSNGIYAYTDLTVGIKNNTVGNSISIFPNPTSDAITIQSQEAIENVSVYDVIGKCVLEIHVTERSQSAVTLDLSEFTRGFYFVAVNGKDNSNRTKILLR